MRQTVVLDVVGLSRSLLGPHTPRLSKLSEHCVDIEPVTPAVTCTAQATYLTGKLPRDHGIVANGWYFRDLNEVWLWRQSNRLLQSERIWQTARRRDPTFTCANTFWWYAMATEANVTITPRPLYLADGVKLPDCYSDPPELRDEFNREFGTFPLFQFWGPGAGIESSEWIARAAMAIEERFAPTLQLVYLPHLDYVLQREGPTGEISKDLGEIDRVCGRLLDYFRDRSHRVIVLSEYGMVPVSRPLHPNRILREAGYVAVKVDVGLESLDLGRSRAFAVSDHQIAHVYVRDPSDVPDVAKLFESVPGMGQVLGAEGKRAFGLDHERSGEVVLLAEPDSWFTYYFWLDDAVAPDYARMVDIHSKPGYDPCELFVDPQIRWPRVRIAATLARKALGFRYTMAVTPINAELVKGSHGVADGSPHATPLFMTSEPKLLDAGSLRAVEVRDRVLDHVFRD